MLNSIQKVVIGGGGIAGSNVVANVVESVNVPIHDWASALSQLAIAVVTIFSLFSKNKRR